MRQQATLYHELRQATQNLQHLCHQLQTKATLTAEQRDDLNAIAAATDKLARQLDAHTTVLEQPAHADIDTLQHIRHDLRNHLNIVVGFTRFWLRELPDNLLLNMITIRHMHKTGTVLMEQVDTIR